MSGISKRTGTVAPAAPAADETLTLEQRVDKLEQAFARFALAGHNAQYAALGSPPDKAGAQVFKAAPPLATLIEREAERVAAEDEVDGGRPIPWQLINQAILAVDAEARKRGEMFPQTSDEQREDRAAVRRVTEMISWYATHGGAVAERLPTWPKVSL